MNLLLNDRVCRSKSESLSKALQRSGVPTHETLGVRRRRELNKQLRQILPEEAGETQ